MPKLAHPLCLIATAAIAGCGITNPYRHPVNTTTSASTSTSPQASPAANPVQNPGEQPAPPPPAPASQSPVHVQRTPAAAIAQFAELYINWSWRTLPAHQRELATLSVGAARLSEQQAAAAASADSTITQTRVTNHGQIITIDPSRTNPKQWVLVTREQTGGNSQYDGLQASYHVTLVQLTRLTAGGWAISRWLPQN